MNLIDNGIEVNIVDDIVQQCYTDSLLIFGSVNQFYGASLYQKTNVLILSDFPMTLLTFLNKISILPPYTVLF